MYIKVEESAESCAQMAIYNVRESIPEKEALKDFILPTKYSEFKLNKPNS